MYQRPLQILVYDRKLESREDIYASLSYQVALSSIFKIFYSLKSVNNAISTHIALTVPTLARNFTVISILF